MADIINFPLRHENHEHRFAGAGATARTNSDHLPAPRPLADTPIGDALPCALAICDRGPKVPLATVFDCAWVIRTGLRWVGRRGKRRSSLPRIVDDALACHCNDGDPAALMFRDWLDDKLPPGMAERDIRAKLETRAIDGSVGPIAKGE